jgi:hypothetical protein
MSEFQMTHVALVGARIGVFASMGFRCRSEMTMRRALPTGNNSYYAMMDMQQRRTRLQDELPIWVHNCITDPAFPVRHQLLMHLRRFEGELRDNRDNAVIAAVLSAGFRNRELNPLELPDSMPMRQRCSLLMNLEPWQEAYRDLETAMVKILASEAKTLDTWLATSGPEIDHAIAV